MYLKSLEMQGFKSFPDKIKLDFNRGLTAVVGPNGSGKSNIGDAVRWVLGEQSTKTLRGSKMEDVIFSGTQYRKSVGYAEVALNIDNNDGALSIDAEEVCVTRKLYRSGDSEYLINGRSVRLKDVCEMFMDTGLGRDGYSIIGQGKVAEIVSAKSNERREIFEEAAGISKFKYKKAEAEKSLQNAEENLLRLNDILKELEVRVEPLKEQSEKAQEFLKLSEKKRTLEVSFWVKKLDELKVILNDLDNKILINTTEYENVDNEINTIESHIQECYVFMQECTVKIENLQASILEAEKSKGEINSHIAVLKNDIEHENNGISEIKKQIQVARLSAVEAGEKTRNELLRKEEIEKQIKNINEDIAQSEGILKTLLEDCEEFNKNTESSSSELNALYIKQSEYTFAITSSENALNDINSQRVLGQENKNELTKSVTDFNDEEKSVKDGLKELNEHTEAVNNKMQGCRKLYEVKKNRLDTLKKEYEDMLFKLKEKEQRKNLLTEMENNMEGFAGSVKEIIKAERNRMISGIHGSIAQLIRVESRYSVAIETALGAALQNIIVENEDTAKRCIRHLKERNAGRATFLPVTSVKGYTLNERGLQNEEGYVAIAKEIVGYKEEYDGIISSLLGRIVIAEDIDTATMIAKKYGYKFRIVTLDGQVINAGGSFTGGSVVRSSGVLTRKNEIEVLESEGAKLKESLEREKESILKIKAEVEKIAADIEGIEEELRQVNNDRIRFVSEQKRIAGMKNQIEMQLKNTEEQLKRLETRYNDSIELIKKSKEKLQLCNDEIKEKEKLQLENQGRKDEMQNKREALSGEISGLKIRKTELIKDFEICENKINELEKNTEKIKLGEQELKGKIAEKEKLINEKQKEVEENNQKLLNAEKSTKDCKNEITKTQQEHKNKEREANENRVMLRSKNDVREHYSKEITKLDERKNAVAKDYDSIISDMWEQYSITKSDAVKTAVEITDTKSAAKELSEYKSKIKSLGNVNLSAIDEYKEVYERYTFMSGQLNDVKVSKNELEKLIADLTDTMKKKFTESFNIISSNFEIIFTDLFGGGKGELTLTDADDVLNCGIEINVAPPGKVIKNLSILSGGEQSFIAIAIYFAILEYKPAPFCILDEIEASLDDVNVIKYAQYLRKFIETTQFILVTHRRGTMEEADTLYGVTMQEKGISKVLKMEQSEIHNIPEYN